jgi:hypothetical protein
MLILSRQEWTQLIAPRPHLDTESNLPFNGRMPDRRPSKGKGQAAVEATQEEPTQEEPTQVSVVLSEDLKDGARQFVNGFNELLSWCTKPDSPEFERLWVKLSMAPGDAGRGVVQTIKLLECADPDYVRKWQDAFDRITMDGTRLFAT